MPFKGSHLMMQRTWWLTPKNIFFLTERERPYTSSKKSHGAQPGASSQDPHHQVQATGLLLLAGLLPKQRAAVWGWDIPCWDLFHRSTAAQGKKPLQPKLDAAKRKWTSSLGTRPAPGPSDMVPPMVPPPEMRGLRPGFQGWPNSNWKETEVHLVPQLQSCIHSGMEWPCTRKQDPSSKTACH